MTDQATKPKSVKLSREDRDTLYNPGTYEVKRINPVSETYLARSIYTGLVFYVKQTPTGYKVKSPSGGTWSLDKNLKCNCPDYLRAVKSKRYCKHQSVVKAVEEFVIRRLKREMEGGIKSLEEIRTEIKEMFE